MPQYCPKCLNEDEQPYYRVGWRFAWHTACLKHRVALFERCAACGKAQQLDQLDVDSPHIAMCAACRADLRETETRPCRTDALRFQEAADDVVKTGNGRCLGADVDTAEWFAVADFFVGVIRQAVRSPTRALASTLGKAGIEWPIRLGSNSGARIERLRRSERETLLGAVHRVMALDAQELRDVIETAGASRQGFFGQRPQVPRTLTVAVPALPDRGKPRGRRTSKQRRTGPRPRHEVQQMMRRLENRMGQEAP